MENEPEKHDPYPGLVERIEKEIVHCSILVSSVEISFPLSRNQFYKNPQIGDRFNWYPTEDGSYGPENFEVVGRENESVLSESDLEQITKLDFRKYISKEDLRKIDERMYKFGHPVKSKLSKIWPFSRFIKIEY